MNKHVFFPQVHLKTPDEPRGRRVARSLDFQALTLGFFPPPSAPLARVAILPGEWRCCREPTLLTTVLGSCVTVCLWDERQAVGGMNHFVLPNDPNRGSSDPRYGNVAMAQLLAAFRKFGCRPVDLQAKVFGGADVLPTMSGHSVGSNNIRFALDLLGEQGIPVMAQRTGGTLGRKLIFNTATGEVLVRALTQTLSITRPGRSRQSARDGWSACETHHRR